MRISFPGRRNKKRYFIVGSQKSGTTWLRDCLDEFVPFCKPEWYFPEYFENIEKWVNTYGASLSQEQRAKRVRRLAGLGWDEIVGAEFRGEKSAYPCSSAHQVVRPDLHPLAVSLLRANFADARVAVLVRDPRAVYNSLCHYLDGFREGFSKEIDVSEFATEWARQNDAWVNDKPDAVVMYENLKANFRETLANTLNGIDISFKDGELLIVENKVYSVDKLRPNQPEIYRTGTVDEWRTKVPIGNIRQIEEAAGSVMARFGYSVM